MNKKLTALYHKKNYNVIISKLSKLAQLKPSERHLLGASYLHTANYKEAYSTLRKLNERQFPNNLAAADYALACYYVGDYETAERLYSDLLRNKVPGITREFILNNLAVIKKNSGDLEGAVECYREILRNKAESPTTWSNIRNVISYFDSQERDQLLSRLKELLKIKQNNCEGEWAGAWFTFAILLQSNSNYFEAYSAFKIGNSKRQPHLDQSPDTPVKSVRETIKMFRSAVAITTDCRKPKAQPLFIVGMPRSGTSLVEQILSTDENVTALGELEFFRQVLAEKKFEYSIGSVSSYQKDYLSKIDPIETKYFTDKMPLNFMWIGYIVSAFPNVKIVHCLRDSRATCWSNFSQNFVSNGNAFAYDLSALVEFYNAYIEMMLLWKTKYPSNIFTVNYDRIVHEPKQILIRLCEFLEIEYTDRLLNFHKSKRIVRTASSEQVRQPLYKNSNEIWQHYSEYLKPYFDDLLY